MSWIEDYLDKLANEGYFNDLPGSGRPIPDIDAEYSPTWWATRWVRRDAALRDSEELRDRLAGDVAAAVALPRHEARRRLQHILAAVAEINSELDTVHQLPTFDVDSVLIRRQWSP